MNNLKMTWSLVLAGSLVTIACGDSKSSMLPTAPSAIGAATQEAETGGADGVSTPTAKGGVPGPPEGKGGNGKKPDDTPGGKAPTNTSPGAPAAPGLKKVEIEGLISAKGGDSITVNGQQVVVPSTCPIRHGQTMFTFADLKVGDRVHVRASKTTTESSRVFAVTTLEATEVKLQNPGDSSDDEENPTDLVSVTATDALASDSTGDTGTFTLARSGSATLLASALTVSYTVGGTASGGDYTPLSGTATFAPGAATTTVLVTPLADGTTEGAETVTLTLTTVAPYDLGSPAEATVTITDTNLPLVTLSAFDSTAVESTSDPGRFRFTRTGSTASALTMMFSVAGTATGGSDYQALPISVIIPAGAAFADVFVMPLADADTDEVAETVTLTVTDGASYDLGATTTATVTIAR
jgi:hypothetical protein